MALPVRGANRSSKHSVMSWRHVIGS